MPCVLPADVSLAPGHGSLALAQQRRAGFGASVQGMLAQLQASRLGQLQSGLDYLTGKRESVQFHRFPFTVYQY